MMVLGGLVLSALIAAFLGSIPFGLIISKCIYGVDIRQTGSGNIGTTNALRTLGKKAGAAVFVLDFSKGLIASLCALGIAHMLLESGHAPAWASETLFVSLSFMCATLGHIFSPWLHFHGGKGIAVAVGCLFVTFGWIGAWIELGIFFLGVIITRYVSVGSLLAATLCFPLSIYYSHGDLLSMSLCMITAACVIWAHRTNISRLMHGTERKLSSKKTISKGV